MGDLELGLKTGEELSAPPPPKSAEDIIPVNTLVLPLGTHVRILMFNMWSKPVA